VNLIDTHQHLIYRDRLGYGWTNGIPALASGDFTLAKYRGLTDGAGVVGSIFMETGVDDADYQAEARFVAGLVGQGPGAPLAQIASCRPEEDTGFDAWLDEGAALHVVGYRRILHVMPDGLSQADTFRRNLRRIGARGLSFDMCFLARQLPIALELAQACDDQVLVLDHCGVPDIAGEQFEEWSKGIKALAALPHVNCKLSGIAAYCAPGTVSVETLAPWVGQVIDSFGPDRILWGGDWPVVDLGGGLPNWIALTRALLAGLGEAEKAAIGTGTAQRVYRVRL